MFKKYAFMDTVEVAPTAFVELGIPTLSLLPTYEMCTTSVSTEGDMRLGMAYTLSMRSSENGYCILLTITKSLQ